MTRDAEDMTTVGPVDHLARLPLPWRPKAELTECGKELGDFPPGRIVTVEQVQRRINAVGKTRAAFTVCLTCTATAERHHRTGGRGALAAIARVIEGLRYVQGPAYEGDPDRRGYEAHRRAWERRRLLEREMEALAALVAAHREEFDGYIKGLAAAPNLADARRARARRAR